MKHWREAEFVIGGWSPPYGDHGWGLLVGEYDDEGALRYRGRVEFGITPSDRQDIEHALRGSIVPGPPFRDYRATSTDVFVAPRLTAEIRYLEVTLAGLLRHASFRQLGRRL